jgi:hypothetical protein
MPDPDDPAFRRLVDFAAMTYARRVESELGSHPNADALVDYHERRLPPPQAEDVRRHLVACAACAEEVQRLDAFDREPDEDSVAASAAAAAESWARFRARGDVGETTVVPVAEPMRHRRPPEWQSWTLAASLLFAVAGAGAFYLASRHATRPTANRGADPQPFLMELMPDGAHPRRDATGIEMVTLPPGMDVIVARLLIGDQTPCTSYSAAIADRSGKTVWQRRGLLRQPTGEFALLLPRAALPPDDYRVQLDCERMGKIRRLASYTLRIAQSE